MKKLFEIVKERNALEYKLQKETDNFERIKKALINSIAELKRLEDIGETGIDLEKVQVAETVLKVRGNPYGHTDGAKITKAEEAIIDISNDCPVLKKEFFGNKTYAGYYQSCNCSYGYGPRHGGIVDEIGLKEEARKRNLTDDEKDACIYYLKNYTKIHKQQ